MAAARFEQLREGDEIRSLFITRTRMLGQPEDNFNTKWVSWKHDQDSNTWLKPLWSALELHKKKNSTVQINVLSHMKIKTTEIGLCGKVPPKITPK